MTSQSVPQSHLQSHLLLTAQAEKCAHCGRPLIRPGTVVPYLGVLGPECKTKFTALLMLVAEVELLQFNVDDEGSQRLAHGIAGTLTRIGFEVRKRVDVRKGILWLDVSSRRATKRGNDMVKTWEQVRAEFEQRLQLAAAERELHSGASA
ncbi:hypothetical protein E7T06_07095 [Deinococcus sp. Arct2-2]|uniref:hypothetical protein n=1 Tax=Deinococcus sp. Arct2-2 TaxID=2568653 RepID=UPI0010A40B42|nr:hypothetical protein [Deinococcus sp. Arct2-2]THF70464.1 hypothetical protein E7T06_07095 [Deinococcus sp. Arct2-2]